VPTSFLPSYIINVIVIANETKQSHKLIAVLTKSVGQKGHEAYFKGNMNINFVKAKLKKNIVKVNLLYLNQTSFFETCI